MRRRRLEGSPARVRARCKVRRLAGGALVAVGVPLHRVDQVAEEGRLFGAAARSQRVGRAVVVLEVMVIEPSGLGASVFSGPRLAALRGARGRLGGA